MGRMVGWIKLEYVHLDLVRDEIHIFYLTTKPSLTS